MSDSPARMTVLEQIQEIDELKFGDVIQNQASGNSYVVVGFVDRKQAIAVRTITATNPGEWKVFREVDVP